MSGLQVTEIEGVLLGQFRIHAKMQRAIRLKVEALELRVDLWIDAIHTDRRWRPELLHLNQHKPVVCVRQRLGCSIGKNLQCGNLVLQPGAVDPSVATLFETRLRGSGQAEVSAGA